MNRSYNPVYMVFSVIFLGIVAIASRPSPKEVRVISPAERERTLKEKAIREAEMTRKQWENHKIELQVMQQQFKTKKHVLVENGHRVPSDTDESDSWFKPGMKDGTDGLPPRAPDGR